MSSPALTATDPRDIQAPPPTPAPAPARRIPVNKWIVTISISFGTLMGAIDSSIVNVALPHIRGAVGATLLEITGPLMMSFAVASNVQYRLKETDGGTLITLRHSSLGLFPDGFRDALGQGWRHVFDRVRRRAETV